jgi:hypothetical protein
VGGRKYNNSQSKVGTSWTEYKYTPIIQRSAQHRPGASEQHIDSYSVIFSNVVYVENCNMHFLQKEYLPFFLTYHLPM